MNPEFSHSVLSLLHIHWICLLKMYYYHPHSISIFCISLIHVIHQARHNPATAAPSSSSSDKIRKIPLTMREIQQNTTQHTYLSSCKRTTRIMWKSIWIWILALCCTLLILHKPRTMIAIVTQTTEEYINNTSRPQFITTVADLNYFPYKQGG